MSDLLAVVMEDGPKGVRAHIFGSKPTDAEDFEELLTGPWRPDDRGAWMSVQSRYFALYRMRNGFKHPEDPTRTASDAKPDAHIFTMRA